MKMDTNNYFESLLNRKMKKVKSSCTIIKALWRYSKNRSERNNYSVKIRKVQKAIRSYLKDISLIKSKNAVRIIEREWINRCEQYFNRKRRTPIFACQKYIKKIIEKHEYQKKYNSMKRCKEMMRSLSMTHKLADKFENFLLFREVIRGPIYDSVWLKIKKRSEQRVKQYVYTWVTGLKNRKNISLALERAKNRLIQKSKMMIEKYLKSVHWACKYEDVVHKTILIQTHFRMYFYRTKFKDIKKKTIIIQRAWRKYCFHKSKSTQFTSSYFGNPASIEEKWKRSLFRSLKKFEGSSQGVEKALQAYEKIKKEKITLFYYLLDVQILCQNPSLASWAEKYSFLMEENLLKGNPVQFLDVTNTHTVAATTNKVYTWGDIDQDIIIKEHTPSQGKLCKIFAEDYMTKIETVNPTSHEYLDCYRTEEKEHCK